MNYSEEYDRRFYEQLDFEFHKQPGDKMGYHTADECKVKIMAIKTQLELIESMSDDTSIKHVCDSINQLCDELCREDIVFKEFRQL
jgi:glucose-6-phosphate-specific signal transduction histidine kinase